MEKLSSYLNRNAIKQSDFATLIGVSRSYLSLILGGKRGVDLNLAFKIEALTGGDVPARSWASSTDGDAAGPLHLRNSEQTVSETDQPGSFSTAAR